MLYKVTTDYTYDHDLAMLELDPRDYRLNHARLPTANEMGGGTWFRWVESEEFYNLVFFTDMSPTLETILSSGKFAQWGVMFKFSHVVYHCEVLEWRTETKREHGLPDRIRAVLKPKHNTPVWWEYAYLDEKINEYARHKAQYIH